MKFKTGYFGISNEFEVENKSKGIEIKVLKGTFSSAHHAIEDILIYHYPQYFNGNNQGLKKVFEQDIIEMERKIKQKKMLIQMIKRKNSKIID